MLETERLMMTPLKREDLPWLIEMRSPEPVNRFLGGIERQNAEERDADEFLSRLS